MFGSSLPVLLLIKATVQSQKLWTQQTHFVISGKEPLVWDTKRLPQGWHTGKRPLSCGGEIPYLMGLVHLNTLIPSLHLLSYPPVLS